MKGWRKIAACLAACLCVGLAGCGGVDLDTPVMPGEPEPVPAPVEKDRRDPVELGKTKALPKQSQGKHMKDKAARPELDEAVEPDEAVADDGRAEASEAGFYGSFMEYMDEAAAGKSYVVSPSSFRAAVSLAAAGAGGETLDALLGALGFGSMDEAEAWYSGVTASVEEFDEMLGHGDGRGGEIDGAYRFLCGSWVNSDLTDGFRPEYMSYVESAFGATSKSVPGTELGAELTSWGLGATDGMIDFGNPDLKGDALVLANAVYLRSSWLDEFSKSGTRKDLFHGADGTDREMEFMNQVETFLYAEKDGARHLLVPMRGDKFFLVRMGGTDGFDLDGMLDALSLMESRKVNLYMPKLDLEYTWVNGSLTGYLASRGAGMAMDGSRADFSRMAEWDAHIADVLQKARLKTDEDGLEAAAVTAVIMDAMSAFDPETPMEFRMDEPFSFAVCSGSPRACVSGDAVPEVLFAGRVV